MHNHFIINSVSNKTGLKLQEGPDSLFKLRALSDDICTQHGLSVLKPYEKKTSKGISTREYRAALKGDSWKFKLINTIDVCMKSSSSKTNFLKQMANLGYQINWSDNRKYITYTTSEGKKCRDNKLHDAKYLKQNMEVYFGQSTVFKRYEQVGGDITGREKLNEAVSTNALCNTGGTVEFNSDLIESTEPNTTQNVGNGGETSELEQYNRPSCTPSNIHDRQDRRYDNETLQQYGNGHEGELQKYTTGDNGTIKKFNEADYQQNAGYIQHTTEQSKAQANRKFKNSPNLGGNGNNPNDNILDVDDTLESLLKQQNNKSTEQSNVADGHKKDQGFKLKM